MAAPAPGRTSCTTQAELLPQDRNALAAAGGRLSQAVLDQDYATLQAALLPAEAAGVGRDSRSRGAGRAADEGRAGSTAEFVSAGRSSLAAPADTQFFCSNRSGSLTVTITMRALPPGRYAWCWPMRRALRWAGSWD
jgi:hypothetical protein